MFGTGGELDVAMSATTGLGLLRVGRLDLTTSADALTLTAGPDIVNGTFYRIVTSTSGVSRSV